MKRAVALLALVLAAFVAGCSPAASIRPLYTDADLQKPIVEPRIEGEWISPNTEEPEKAGTKEEVWLRWKVTPPDKPSEPYSYYSVEFRAAKTDAGKGEEADSYDVRLVAMGDKLFFDAEFRRHTEGQLDVGPMDILGLVPAHLVGRIWVQQDFVRIALLRPDCVEDTWPAGFHRINSSNYGDDSIVITGSTQELRDFLVRNADNQKALAYAVYLCRPGTDCGARAAEDALGRTPDDDDTLDAAAKFFSGRHNYVRAATLRRRLVELDPEKITSHSDLSDALLLSRDFAGARRELEVVQKLALGDPPVTVDSMTNYAGSFYTNTAENIVWSYFLEGKYIETVNAAKSYKHDKYHFSVNPLLLRYYSLLRLGRRAEAESLVKEETAEFKGSSEEHILLLDAQGRVSDRYLRSDQKTEASLRFSFFAGLHDIATGQPDRARDHFEYVVSEHGGSVLALAAQIELERLGPKLKK